MATTNINIALQFIHPIEGIVDENDEINQDQFSTLIQFCDTFPILKDIPLYLSYFNNTVSHNNVLYLYDQKIVKSDFTSFLIRRLFKNECLRLTTTFRAHMKYSSITQAYWEHVFQILYGGDKHTWICIKHGLIYTKNTMAYNMTSFTFITLS
jgi:hypothetical protein